MCSVVSEFLKTCHRTQINNTPFPTPFSHFFSCWDVENFLPQVLKMVPVDLRLEALFKHPCFQKEFSKRFNDAIEVYKYVSIQYLYYQCLLTDRLPNIRDVAILNTSKPLLMITGMGTYSLELHLLQFSLRLLQSE